MLNKATRTVNAKLAYELITSTLLTTRLVSALKLIWKCNIPLKLIYFNWLCMENRINTWDNLIRKGWAGPNRCCLCRIGEEYVNHLFSACSFTHNIINCLSRILQLEMDWNAPSLENLELWFSKENEFLHLPLLISWNLWLTRNRIVF